MKFEHRRYISVLSMSLVLVGGHAKAADPVTSQDTEKVVDAYITVMTMAYPPAGGALAAAKGMMSMFGFFGKPDAVGEAIKQINQRLDAIDQRMDSLENNLQATRNEVFRNANLENTRELRRHRDSIEQVLLGLQSKPTDKYTKQKLVLDAKQVCNSLLEDRKLWIWSDLVLKDHVWNGKKIKKGTMLEPDFKPMPTLEVYASALATWMAAIEYSSGGDKVYVRHTFAADLKRHIDFLSVRPGWNELTDTPQTLPEEIQSRVVGYYVPTSRLPGPGRVVTIAEYSRDDMGREIKLVGNLTYVAGSANELATVPANLLNRATPREEQIESDYGLMVMQTLADKLKYLRTKGTIREQVITGFTPTYTGRNLIYFVKPDGGLYWQEDNYKTAPMPQPSVYKEQVSRSLGVPKQVGEGWDTALGIFPGGASTVYGLRQNGDLMWYRHNDYLNGARSWQGPTKVGTGWNNAQLIPAGDGIFYTLLPDGTLNFYRHTNYKTGEGLYAGWQPPVKVSGGWNKFKKVFAGGNGVIYAVTQDGKLLWFWHDWRHPVAMPGPGTGMVHSAQISLWARTWKGPKEIGTGWDGFTKLFSGGQGDIFAILPSGELRIYRHVGYNDGTPTWGNYVTVDKSGWDEYPFVFATLPSHNAEDDIVVK